MVLQGRDSVYGCDLFEPWVRSVRETWDWPGDDERPLRVVCDHLRSAVVVIGDGVRPSNTGRGYVLRRLIRRVLTRLWRIDPTGTLEDLPDEPLVFTLRHFEQQMDVVRVRELLVTEERRFRELVRRGRPIVHRMRSRGPLSADDFGYLSETHGLPRELVLGLLPE